MSGPDARGYGGYTGGPRQGAAQGAAAVLPADDADAGAVRALRVVAEGGRPDPLTMLKRFLHEVKYHDFHRPAASAPFGRPLAAPYDLERLDPQHRFGHQLPNAVARGPADNARLAEARDAVLQFLHEQPYGSATQFLQWVRLRRPAQVAAVEQLLTQWQAAPPPDFQQLGMVRYLDSAARQVYVIEPGTDGLFYHREPRRGGVGPAAAFAFTTEVFDTSASRAAWGGRQRKAIWVQGPSGRFYSSLESQAGVFHHSSFLGGHDVKAAGDWEVIQGQLRTLSAMSGHYQPTIEQLHGAVLDLRRVSRRLLEHAVVEVCDLQAHRNVAVPALDFADLGERNRVGLRRYSPALMG